MSSRRIREVRWSCLTSKSFSAFFLLKLRSSFSSLLSSLSILLVRPPVLCCITITAELFSDERSDRPPGDFSRSETSPLEIEETWFQTAIVKLKLYKSEPDGLFTSSFLPDLVKLRLKFWPKLLMGDLSDGVTRPVETLEDFVFVDSFDSGLRKEIKNTGLLKNRTQKWKCRLTIIQPLSTDLLIFTALFGALLEFERG